jgi:hypothetical protein
MVWNGRPLSLVVGLDVVVDGLVLALGANDLVVMHDLGEDLLTNCMAKASLYLCLGWIVPCQWLCREGLVVLLNRHLTFEDVLGWDLDVDGGVWYCYGLVLRDADDVVVGAVNDHVNDLGRNELYLGDCLHWLFFDNDLCIPSATTLVLLLTDGARVGRARLD